MTEPDFDEGEPDDNGRSRYDTYSSSESVTANPRCAKRTYDRTAAHLCPYRSAKSKRSTHGTSITGVD